MQEIDIAKMALNKNHVFDTVTSSDGTIENLQSPGISASVVRTFYDLSRRQVLRMAPWSCILKRVPLDPADASFLFYGYLGVYSLPGDYLNHYGVFSGVGASLPFLLERGLLYCNEQPYLSYVPDEKDPSKWDPLLTSVIVLQLASDIAFPLTGDHKNEVAFAQMGAAVVEEAIRQTKRERMATFGPSAAWAPGLFPEVKS
jgi:hypothetical protein